MLPPPLSKCSQSPPNTTFQPSYHYLIGFMSFVGLQDVLPSQNRTSLATIHNMSSASRSLQCMSCVGSTPSLHPVLETHKKTSLSEHRQVSNAGSPRQLDMVEKESSYKWRKCTLVEYTVYANIFTGMYTSEIFPRT